MSEHHLSRATHTLDLAQLAQIDERLAASGAPTLTAADLGLADDAVPGAAVLLRVWCRGDPEFPDIFGDFGGPSTSASASAGPVAAGTHVRLHTPSLLALSRLLGLHHRWGV